MRRHEALQSYSLAMADLARFLSHTERGTENIQHQLMTFDAQRQAESRGQLKVKADAILFCGRQTIALWGHRERKTRTVNLATHSSKNPKIFQAVLHLMARNGCEILQQHFRASHGATFLSPQVQNEVIECIGDCMQKDIVARLKEGKILLYSDGRRGRHSEL